MRTIIQPAALVHNDGQHHQGQNRAAEAGDAPRAGPAGDPRHEHRGRSPAHIARNAMDRKRVAHVLGRNTLVQNREINGVKGRIAQTGQHRGRHQHGVVLRTGGHQTGQRKTGQGRKQNGPRPHFVHQKTGQHLPYARDNKKHRHHRAQLDIAVAKLRHQPRKQWRQQQMKKMRSPVGQTHQANGAGIVPQRSACSGIGHAGILERVHDLE